MKMKYLLSSCLFVTISSYFVSCGQRKTVFKTEQESSDKSISSSDSIAKTDQDPAKESDKKHSDVPIATPEIPDPPENPPRPRPKPRPTDHNVFKNLPKTEGQRKILCSRKKSDKLREFYCSKEAPKITSLEDIQKLLGIAFTNRNNPGKENNGEGGNPSFTLTGHSSSLVARFTTPINPRAIIFSPSNRARPNPNYVAMGFLRGEQLVEIVANDPRTGIASFFLLVFEQACNKAEKGCLPGDLLTPKIEKNWENVTIYEDEDLKNTIADCMQCHQPDGPGTKKVLRMQELLEPWSHFLVDDREGGQALIRDYFLAHDNTEDYAGIPGSHISSSDPEDLENLIIGNGFREDNNIFDTGNISNEVRASNPLQPGNNQQAGISATWLELYERAVRGDIIGIPYHDVKVSDQDKLEKMALEYRLVMTGQKPTHKLPDIRQTFKKDRNLGFRVKEGLSGKGIITQACRQCHNSRLDQTISRSRFNVDLLDTMSREEKETAILRLKLPPEDLKAMPPRRFRDLDERERNLAVRELQK